ncbi:hypothetical protein [Lyngbya sp. CCY1209]|uniref:hypothetical protein n=1 Tax=Lyngbya sp. CCY1209 TaxID=2886103 RepID=UPI002D2005FA|nr:hypothetical protein [Lyngbya sp. CCY1209]MEB3887150.1 hypothetical protein [Lyngbya sp. CCY1209]
MKKSILKKILEVTVWIAAEILLNLLGLDDLADYGEYLFSPQVFVISNPVIFISYDPCDR